MRREANIYLGARTNAGGVASFGRLGAFRGNGPDAEHVRNKCQHSTANPSSAPENRTPGERDMKRWSCRIGFAWLACASAGLIPVAGCGPAAPTGKPSPPAVAEEPDAPMGAAIADPALREARDQADSTLAGLLTGNFGNDPDLAPVAKKMKGYQAASIKAQEIVREGTAQFRGLLTGPAGQATFKMTLVKQRDGHWSIGAFSGPNPE
jgi:hypothetical protein